MFCVVLYIFVFGFSISNGQLAAIIGATEERDARCSSWSEWGDCIWLRSPYNTPNPRFKIGANWNKDYFDQLPMRCKRHIFYLNAKRYFEKPITNTYEYFKELTSDRIPCGMCSYQQSCAHRSSCDKGVSYSIAERPCQAPYARRQNRACTLYANLAPLHKDCTIWPARDRVDLSSVSPGLRRVIEGMPFTNCVKSSFLNGTNTCRCCCMPFRPDPNRNYLCVAPDGHDGRINGFSRLLPRGDT